MNSKYYYCEKQTDYFGDIYIIYYIIYSNFKNRPASPSERLTVTQ